MGLKTDLQLLIEKAPHELGVLDVDVKAHCDALVTGTFPSGQVLRQVLTELGYHRKLTYDFISESFVFMWDLKTVI